MTTLDWRARAEPLTPAGLVAVGVTARTVLAALGERQGLRFVATRSLLVLLGESSLLPWADGVRYCAPDPQASGLWLPTWLEPSLPSDLVHSALQRRGKAASLLLWPDPELVLPLDEALPLQAESLAWLREELA